MEMTITIPENWSEVTLEQYMKFYKSIKPYEKTDQYERKVLENAIYYFCNISADVYHKLPQSVFTNLSNSIIELIQTSNKQELVLNFELLDQKYGFIPDIDSISYGEYADLVTYSKDTWQNMALLMSILYRPIIEQKGEKYLIESYSGTVDSRVELFNKKLTMDIIFGALSFFFRLQMDLLQDILTCSINQIQKETLKDMKLNRSLQKSGDYIQQFTLLQEETFSNLRQLLD